jgi:hypothetical protein
VAWQFPQFQIAHRKSVLPISVLLVIFASMTDSAHNSDHDKGKHAAGVDTNTTGQDNGGVPEARSLVADARLSSSTAKSAFPRMNIGA